MGRGLLAGLGSRAHARHSFSPRNWSAYNLHTCLGCARPPSPLPSLRYNFILKSPRKIFQHTLRYMTRWVRDERETQIALATFRERPSCPQIARLLHRFKTKHLFSKLKQATLTFYIKKETIYVKTLSIIELIFTLFIILHRYEKETEIYSTWLCIILRTQIEFAIIFCLGNYMWYKYIFYAIHIYVNFLYKATNLIRNKLSLI